MSSIRLTAPDGGELSLPEGSPLSAVAPAKAVAAVLDGREVDLAHRPRSDGAVRFLTPEDPDGLHVFRHSSAHLRLQRDHVVRLETRPPNIEGVGQVTQRDLLRNSLRMRPDRIIIGEVRGAEALDMLQAMNTGHEGSMTTVHANSTRDALRRVENMVTMAGLQYPVHVIRQQMGSALQIVVHLARLTGGTRRVVSIAEIAGMEGDQICLQDIFVYRQTGLDDDGRATGRFEACGVRARAIERVRAEGFELPNRLFERRVLAAA